MVGYNNIDIGLEFPSADVSIGLNTDNVSGSSNYYYYKDVIDSRITDVISGDGRLIYLPAAASNLGLLFYFNDTGLRVAYFEYNKCRFLYKCWCIK